MFWFGKMLASLINLNNCTKKCLWEIISKSKFITKTLEYSPHHQKVDIWWYTGFNLVIFIIHRKFCQMESAPSQIPVPGRHIVWIWFWRQIWKKKKSLIIRLMHSAFVLIRYALILELFIWSMLRTWYWKTKLYF